MAQKQNRLSYRDMEQLLTIALLVDAVLFVIFLVASGFGVIWLKVITAIISIVGSSLCLGYLYLIRELRRQRSLWMTVGFAAIIVVLVFSLFLNYPSPNTNKPVDNSGDLGNIPAVGAITLVLE